MGFFPTMYVLALFFHDFLFVFRSLVHAVPILHQLVDIFVDLGSVTVLLQKS
jgi:hypothetical protein